MKWVVVVIAALLIERVGETLLFKKAMSTNSKVLVVVTTALLAMISVPYLIEGTTILITLEVVIFLVATKTLIDLRSSSKKTK